MTTITTTPCPVCGQVPEVEYQGELWHVIHACSHLVCRTGHNCDAMQTLAHPRSWNVPGGAWWNGWPVPPDPPYRLR